MAGTSQEASNMRTRGQLRQREKKPKSETRLSKLRKTMPPPIPVPRPTLDRVEPPQRRVRLALAKFNEVRTATKKQPAEILKGMQTSDPQLLGTNGELGQVPGVDVGDRFNSRAELKLVGLHGDLMAGIHWKDVKGLHWRDVNFETTPGFVESIAISVVISGEYEDNVDRGNTVIYTGEGGKAGSKRQTHNQKLLGGNEALRNNQLRSCPVRVIKGEGTRKVYTYYGLYQVTEEKRVKGKSGFLVYQFTLTREDGQGPLPG